MSTGNRLLTIQELDAIIRKVIDKFYPPDEVCNDNTQQKYDELVAKCKYLNIPIESTWEYKNAMQLMDALIREGING
jgi:hypothetical protein